MLANTAIGDSGLKLFIQTCSEVPQEKLIEEQAFSFSAETLSKWMISEKLWLPESRKKTRIHQSGPRRACLGELVQIDASPHHWFEERGDCCTLIVFIDAATSRLLHDEGNSVLSLSLSRAYPLIPQLNKSVPFN